MHADQSGCLFDRSSTPCANNRCGIMCAFCRPGYQSDMGGACTPCPSGAGSWVVLVFIALLVVALMLAQFYILLRADRELLAGISDTDGMGATDLSDMHDLEESELDTGDSEASGSGSSGSGSDDSGSRNDSDSGSASDSDSDASASHSGSGSGSDSDSVSRSSRGATKKKKSTAVLAPVVEEEEGPDLTPEPTNEELARLYQPAAPAANFTYKLKIFLGFLQIITNVSSGLDTQWPQTYKTFMTYFSIVNFDFILSSVTSADCIGDVTYYKKSGKTQAHEGDATRGTDAANRAACTHAAHYTSAGKHLSTC
jgi:hypothetical protein